MEREEAIVLIGMMGAGKTTVGRELARRTEWPLYETDVNIEKRFGLSIEEFFASRSEEEFRTAETEALEEMPALRAIVATGGGIVLRPENLAMLARLGSVIYLEADEAALVDRVSRQKKTRPLLETNDPQDTFSRLLREREPLYRKAADFIVNTSGLSVAETAEAIMNHVG